MPADVLRQRRDLYALAIGLELYNLAGGKLVADTAFGSLLPLSLSDPHYLLAAAWIGFFYFWFRFWLISEVKPFGAFVSDVRWQAGDSLIVRRIAATVTNGRTPTEREHFSMQLLQPGGPVPRVEKAFPTPVLSLAKIRRHVQRPDETSSLASTFGPAGIEISRPDRLRFWWAWLRAIPAAIFRERAFTDYTLPHLFALVTALHGSWRYIIAPLMGV
jgi:hypothetical protein